MKKTDENFTEIVEPAETSTTMESTEADKAQVMNEQLAAATENPMIALLLKHPKMCGMLGALLDGKNDDEAIEMNFKGWQRNEPYQNIDMDNTTDETKAKILDVCNTIKSGSLTPEIMELIRKGTEYDEAVATAKKQGYIDGKNEKIDFEKRPHIKSEKEPGEQQKSLFPKYGKRSIWD